MLCLLLRLFWVLLTFLLNSLSLRILLFFLSLKRLLLLLILNCRHLLILNKFWLFWKYSCLLVWNSLDLLFITWVIFFMKLEDAVILWFYLVDIVFLIDLRVRLLFLFQCRLVISASYRILLRRYLNGNRLLNSRLRLFLWWTRCLLRYLRWSWILCLICSWMLWIEPRKVSLINNLIIFP